VDKQERIITKVCGGWRTQIPEKARGELGLRDYDDWFNDHTERWCIEKVRV